MTHQEIIDCIKEKYPPGTKFKPVIGSDGECSRH